MCVVIGEEAGPFETEDGRDALSDRDRRATFARFDSTIILDRYRRLFGNIFL